MVFPYGFDIWNAPHKDERAGVKCSGKLAGSANTFLLSQMDLSEKTTP
jgi:hypothetical protein